jgi:phenylacetate-coenzyme A ligase PaaK-like adenylate-forming protein
MDASQSALPTAASQLVQTLLAFMAQDGCNDAQFDELALHLFAHQYENNQPFRRFCQGRGATPRKIQSWRDIPAVPINGFKELTLSCVPVDS